MVNIQEKLLLLFSILIIIIAVIISIILSISSKKSLYVRELTIIYSKKWYECMIETSIQSPFPRTISAPISFQMLDTEEDSIDNFEYYTPIDTPIVSVCQSRIIGGSGIGIIGGSGIGDIGDINTYIKYIKSYHFAEESNEKQLLKNIISYYELLYEQSFRKEYSIKYLNQPNKDAEIKYDNIQKYITLEESKLNALTHEIKNPKIIHMKPHVDPPCSPSFLECLANHYSNLLSIEKKVAYEIEPRVSAISKRIQELDSRIQFTLTEPDSLKSIDLRLIDKYCESNNLTIDEETEVIKIYLYMKSVGREDDNFIKSLSFDLTDKTQAVLYQLISSKPPIQAPNTTSQPIIPITEESIPLPSNYHIGVDYHDIIISNIIKLGKKHLIPDIVNTIHTIPISMILRANTSYEIQILKDIYSYELTISESECDTIFILANLFCPDMIKFIIASVKYSSLPIEQILVSLNVFSLFYHKLEYIPMCAYIIKKLGLLSSIAACEFLLPFIPYEHLKICFDLSLTSEKISDRLMYLAVVRSVEFISQDYSAFVRTLKISPKSHISYNYAIMRGLHLNKSPKCISNAISVFEFNKKIDIDLIPENKYDLLKLLCPSTTHELLSAVVYGDYTIADSYLIIKYLEYEAKPRLLELIGNKRIQPSENILKALKTAEDVGDINLAYSNKNPYYPSVILNKLFESIKPENVQFIKSAIKKSLDPIPTILRRIYSFKQSESSITDYHSKYISLHITEPEYAKYLLKKLDKINKHDAFVLNDPKEMFDLVISFPDSIIESFTRPKSKHILNKILAISHIISSFSDIPVKRLINFAIKWKITMNDMITIAKSIQTVHLESNYKFTENFIYRFVSLAHFNPKALSVDTSSILQICSDYDSVKTLITDLPPYHADILFLDEMFSKQGGARGATILHKLCNMTLDILFSKNYTHAKLDALVSQLHRKLPKNTNLKELKKVSKDVAGVSSKTGKLLFLLLKEILKEGKNTEAIEKISDELSSMRWAKKRSQNLSYPSIMGGELYDFKLFTMSTNTTITESIKSIKSVKKVRHMDNDDYLVNCLRQILFVLKKPDINDFLNDRGALFKATKQIKMYTSINSKILDMIASVSGIFVEDVSPYNSAIVDSYKLLTEKMINYRHLYSDNTIYCELAAISTFLYFSFELHKYKITMKHLFELVFICNKTVFTSNNTIPFQDDELVDQIPITDGLSEEVILNAIALLIARQPYPIVKYKTAAAFKHINVDTSSTFTADELEYIDFFCGDNFEHIFQLDHEKFLSTIQTPLEPYSEGYRGFLYMNGGLPPPSILPSQISKFISKSVSKMCQFTIGECLQAFPPTFIFSEEIYEAFDSLLTPNCRPLTIKLFLQTCCAYPSINPHSISLICKKISKCGSTKMSRNFITTMLDHFIQNAHSIYSTPIQNKTHLSHIEYKISLDLCSQLATSIEHFLDRSLSILYAYKILEPNKKLALIFTDVYKKLSDFIEGLPEESHNLPPYKNRPLAYLILRSVKSQFKPSESFAAYSRVCKLVSKVMRSKNIEDVRKNVSKLKHKYDTQLTKCAPISILPIEYFSAACAAVASVLKYAPTLPNLTPFQHNIQYAISSIKSPTSDILSLIQIAAILPEHSDLYLSHPSESVKKTLLYAAGKHPKIPINSAAVVTAGSSYSGKQAYVIYSRIILNKSIPASFPIEITNHILVDYFITCQSPIHFDLLAIFAKCYQTELLPNSPLLPKLISVVDGLPPISKYMVDYIKDKLCLEHIDVPLQFIQLFKSEFKKIIKPISQNIINLIVSCGQSHKLSTIANLLIKYSSVRMSESDMIVRIRKVIYDKHLEIFLPIAILSNIEIPENISLPEIMEDEYKLIPPIVESLKDIKILPYLLEIYLFLKRNSTPETEYYYCEENIKSIADFLYMAKHPPDISTAIQSNYLSSKYLNPDALNCLVHASNLLFNAPYKHKIYRIILSVNKSPAYFEGLNSFLYYAGGIMDEKNMMQAIKILPQSSQLCSTMGYCVRYMYDTYGSSASANFIENYSYLFSISFSNTNLENSIYFINICSILLIANLNTPIYADCICTDIRLMRKSINSFKEFLKSKLGDDYAYFANITTTTDVQAIKKILLDIDKKNPIYFAPISQKPSPPFHLNYSELVLDLIDCKLNI